MNGKVTWQWLAGFFDGEGSISFSVQKLSPYSYELHVSLSQSSKYVMKAVKEFLGFGSVDGPYKPRNGGRGVYVLYVRKLVEIEEFLRKLLPYLVLKRRRALLALQYLKCRERNLRGRGHLLPEVEVRWRRMHYKLMRIYNEVGL